MELHWLLTAVLVSLHSCVSPAVSGLPAVAVAEPAPEPEYLPPELERYFQEGGDLGEDYEYLLEEYKAEEKKEDTVRYIIIAAKRSAIDTDAISSS